MSGVVVAVVLLSTGVVVNSQATNCDVQTRNSLSGRCRSALIARGTD